MAGPQLRSTPFPRNYKPIGGNVAVPNSEDPVDVQQLGRDTYYDFGMGTREPAAAVPSGTLVQGLRELLLGKQPIPPAPPMPAMPPPSIGDLRMMDERAMPPMPPQLSSKPARPTESYGTNRGGFGGAGRGNAQFGKSRFDVETYTPPEMSIADLRKLDDKPWDLDENTNADVQAGTSLTPKPEQNIVDKEPDLQSPQGLYQALAKKYPDILTQNLDDLQRSRVSMEDVDQLRDRGGLGSLFIAASKAASGAGSIGGKTAESIAPAIVQREDALARQQLKDRMDVASENMAMNAKAVDLAMKQINFADEREQYDPNSEVSKFARDFMREEFQVNVPDNVPAYQLKQFLPAIVQKYQALETGAYRNAMLDAQSGIKREQIEAAATEKKAQREFVETQNKLNRELQRDLQRERIQAKPAAKTPKVPETPREKLQNKLVEKDAEVYQKRLQGLQKLDGGLKALDDATTAEQIVQIGQSLLKTLNDPENSDAVGVDEAKRLADELQSWSVLGPGGLLRIGRDLPGFKQRVKLLRDRLYNTANSQYQSINQKMPDLVDPPPTYGATRGKTSGTRSIEEIDAEIARIKAEKARRKGGQ
jgi:hypothetical protein